MVGGFKQQVHCGRVLVSISLSRELRAPGNTGWLVG